VQRCKWTVKPHHGAATISPAGGRTGGRWKGPAISPVGSATGGLGKRQRELHPSRRPTPLFHNIAFSFSLPIPNRTEIVTSWLQQGGGHICSVRPDSDLSEIEGHAAGDAEDKKLLPLHHGPKNTCTLHCYSTSLTLMIAGSPPPVPRTLLYFLCIFRMPPPWVVTVLFILIISKTNTHVLLLFLIYISLMFWYTSQFCVAVNN
jgi:hypothetical protein